MGSGDFIKSYWDSQGKTFGSSHVASWGDHNIIQLEIDTIAANIPEGSDVLDVGCANGYSSFNQLQRNPRSITGLDYSETLIEAAKKEWERHPEKEKLSFDIGDVREIEFPDGKFDVVYTTRVLINLPNWEDQVQGIKECLRVAKKGGTVIFSEAFWEPLQKLNALRIVAGLTPLVEHDFNRYLKSPKLEDLLGAEKVSFEVNDFSSIYYLGTRFIRDLVQEKDQIEGFKNPFNDAFLEIEQGYTAKDFGVQKAYIVRK